MPTNRILRIHERDDVAVALEPIAGGARVQVSGAEVTASEAIAPGHKIALRAIAAGANVVKYGWPIGHATSDITPGAWVHTHNLATNLSGLLEYAYEPQRDVARGGAGAWEAGGTGARRDAGAPYEPERAGADARMAGVDACPTFLGYRRPDGRVGTRNELWIIPTVGCVNKAAETMARLAHQRFACPTEPHAAVFAPPTEPHAAAFARPTEPHAAAFARPTEPRLKRGAAFAPCEKERFPGPALAGPIDGVYAFTHPYGCSQLCDDYTNTQSALAAMIRHPNCAGALVMGLGCERNRLEKQLDVAAPLDPRRVRFFNAQDVEDEIETGLRALEELAEYAAGCVREPCPASDLVLGMKCGGSDGFSGLTANPLLGRVTDLVSEWGGTSMISEVPEMFGAEQILMNRCADRATFQATVAMINGMKQYFLDHHEPVYENPAPGNRDGGITTLEEKSLGCTEKGGRAVVTEVLDYARPVSRCGLALVTAPGNDLVATNALVFAGATVVLFTTGRGTPFGGPVPTLKIATNTALARRKPKWIDFDAGRLVSENADFDALGSELMQLVLDTASGHYRARNEVNNMRELTLWQTGVIV